LRMADFAKWALAAETGLGFNQGSFLEAYGENRTQANDLALDSSVVTEPLKAFMDGRDYWTGTNTELLTEIRKKVSDETARASGFPKTPRKLAGDLRRLAPNLRRIGVDIRFLKPSGHKKQRLVEITKVGDVPSAQSASSAAVDLADLNNKSATPGQPSASVRNGAKPSAISDSKQGHAGNADGAGGLFPNSPTSSDDEGEVRL